MKSLRSLVPASEILSLSSKALLSSHRLFLIVLETFTFCMFYKYHIVFFCEVSLGLFLSTQGSPVRCSNKIFVVKYVSPFRTHNSFFFFLFLHFLFLCFPTDIILLCSKCCLCSCCGTVHRNTISLCFTPLQLEDYSSQHKYLW